MKLFKKFCYYVLVYVMVGLALTVAKFIIRFIRGFIKGIIIGIKAYKKVKYEYEMEQTRESVVAEYEDGKVEFV